MPGAASEQMPAFMFKSAKLNRSVGDMISIRESHTAELDAGLRVPGQYVMGFRLPDWQRGLVWTQAQQRRLIESAWMGYDLGTVMVTNRNSTHLGRRDPLCGLLIDGQQRLEALRAYLAGEFTVFGATWEHTTVQDKTRFLLEVQFGYIELNSDYDEATLVELYTRLNYGGSPHTEAQRPAAGRAEGALG